MQMIKAKMDTDMQMSKSMHGTEHMLDGSHENDYAQSFRLLLDMIDRTLDDYKEEL